MPSRSATPGRKFCTKTSADLTSCLEQRDAPRLGQIDGDGALPSVHVRKERADVSDAVPEIAHPVAACGVLDLHDLGAEVGEHHRGERAGDHLRRVDDGETVSGPDIAATLAV